jgi:hypothetical protein
MVQQIQLLTYDEYAIARTHVNLLLGSLGLEKNMGQVIYMLKTFRAVKTNGEMRMKHHNSICFNSSESHDGDSGEWQKCQTGRKPGFMVKHYYFV